MKQLIVPTTYITALLLLLTACQRVQHQRMQPGTATDTLLQPVSGTWYNDNDIFGCMTLTVTDSGHFSFFEAGTTVNRYSAGTVSRESNHIHFTSDAQYRNGTPPQSMHDTAVTQRIALSGRLPHPGDTLTIYLDNEHYLLNGDTLYKLDNEGGKTDMKFHR
jgi:hypothetical protein